MCFHSKQSKDAQSLEQRFKAKALSDEPIQSEHYNAFSYPKTPIISNKQQDQIQLYQWGLIPEWAKDKSIQAYTLNARIETLSEKPSFKNKLNNRCLILADGFMEWQWLDPKGKKKQGYLITLPHQDAFAFAGLWSEWLDPTTGELLNTYTILTTEATGLMAEVHNSKKRMPIILAPEQEAAWLSLHNISDFRSCEVALKAERIVPLQRRLF
jgi:putative SOS response-associated peptidase YedK